MNPSAQGWIDKLLVSIKQDGSYYYLSEEVWYNKLRRSGFIYGTNICPIVSVKTDNQLTESEITKINLLTALLYVYHLEKKEASQQEALKSILAFYQLLKAKRFSFIDKIFVGSSSGSQLEKVIHQRIQIDQNLFTKNFSNIITNALLFIDVLSFSVFVKESQHVVDYAKNLENSVTSVVLHALKSKELKTTFDDLLMKLVQASLRYHEVKENISLMDYHRLLKSRTSVLEKKYIFDLGCMAVWNDFVVNEKESQFIMDLGKNLKFSKKYISTSIKETYDFIHVNKHQISFFNYSNPVQHFYEQSTKTVNKLINRNRKRLLKELQQSKELMLLISKSAVTELNEGEKQQMKDQLIDIFKTIPSLAIFALPGGMVLLPLVIKLIPNLLPSSFDENRIEDQNEAP